MTPSYKKHIKQILALDDRIKIKAPLLLKSGNKAVPVVLDSNKIVYFLLTLDGKLQHDWYYNREELNF